MEPVAIQTSPSVWLSVQNGHGSRHLAETCARHTCRHAHKHTHRHADRNMYGTRPALTKCISHTIVSHSILVVMAYTVMAHTVMACIVMACIVMADAHQVHQQHYCVASHTRHYDDQHPSCTTVRRTRHYSAVGPSLSIPNRASVRGRPETRDQ